MSFIPINPSRSELILSTAYVDKSSGCKRNCFINLVMHTYEKYHWYQIKATNASQCWKNNKLWLFSTCLTKYLQYLYSISIHIFIFLNISTYRILNLCLTVCLEAESLLSTAIALLTTRTGVRSWPNVGCRDKDTLYKMLTYITLSS